ncbi:MAG: hypothetical protein O7F16_10905 [Acidobacteria bacterium]|nr:hypothetical protein [Acidobacteriota bacterium]
MLSHIFLLVLFSTLVSIFFGALTRNDLREGARVALILFLSLVGISLALAYIMAPFPLR